MPFGEPRYDGLQQVTGFGGAAVLDEVVRVAARGPQLEPPGTLSSRGVERLAILPLRLVDRTPRAIDFGLQPRVLGVVGMLAGGLSDAGRVVERRLGPVEQSRPQLRAGQQHQ